PPLVSSRGAGALHSAQRCPTSRRRAIPPRVAAAALRESMKDLRTFFVVAFCCLPRINDRKLRLFQADSAPQAFLAPCPQRKLICLSAAPNRPLPPRLVAASRSSSY